jgi:phospholipid/cholesterol/gamma-HCH transport system substrate-binding protein
VKSFTERNPTIIGIVVVALIAAGTGAALLLNGGFFKDRYTVQAVFADSAGLRDGDKIRVAGVTAGEVGAIRQRGAKVEVDLKIDESVDLPRDTRAEIVVETLLGNKYVRLVAGDDWSHRLEGGSVIKDTSTPTEVLDLQNEGTALLEDLDGKAFDDLLGKLDRITKGQRENVGDIVVGLNRLTTAVNQRQREARRLIESSRTVTDTLSDRDEDLLAALDDINVVLDGLAKRRVQLATLLDQTSETARKTADLVAENRPELDAVLDELHADLRILGGRQQELAATLSGLTNAIDGFSSVGYSGPDDFPNRWANMYTQLIGPLSPDALFGSCGFLDDAFDIMIGPDPITNCADRTGPLPSTSGSPGSPSKPTSGSSPKAAGSGGASTPDASAPAGSSPEAEAETPNPLDALFGPLTGAAS